MQVMSRTHSVAIQISYVFLLMQPVIDVLTSLSIRSGFHFLSFGIILRALFLGLMIFVLLYMRYTNKRMIIVYFSILFVFCVLSFVTQWRLKPVFAGVMEITYLVKVVYFPICLLFFYVVFREKRSLFFLSLAIIFTGLIMTISGLTGTAFASYEGGKAGHVGWFYAGNEIGAILAMGLPIALLFVLKQSWWWLIGLLLVMYGLLAVGTKVGYGAIMITFIVGIICLWLCKRERVARGKRAVVLLLFILFLAVTPYTPVAHNMTLHLDWLGLNSEDDGRANISDEQLDNIVYSGREKYWADYQTYFRDSPLLQKLVGMGYGGNYKEGAKMIEMDFLDLFYSFGILGFIVYLLPLLVIVSFIIKQWRLDFIAFFQLRNILVATGACLAIGIAFVAGHVFTAPGVSIYLAFLCAYLATNAKRGSENEAID